MVLSLMDLSSIVMIESILFSVFDRNVDLGFSVVSMNGWNSGSVLHPN